MHGLFDVRGVDKGAVRLVELFSRIERTVGDPREHRGFSVGDVIEARLVPTAEGWAFTPAHCWHPTAAAGALKGEAARRRAQGAACKPGALVDEAAQRSLKADRYRQIALERIYDFSAA